ncbi:MAG: heme-copper oxidase subunit III [Chloroflexi bacterium]|nr:heme-copper oxidase subunit III [Chloroflexota bacterium]
MTVSSQAHAEHAHHSPFHYDYSVLNRLGLWLFFGSETMIFIVLLVVRFALAGNTTPHGLDQNLGLLITAILLASSLTAYRAESAIAADDRKKFLRNLLGTIIMGTVFLLAVVAYEWPEAPKHGITPDTGYGAAFFAMTGMHAFHVFTGVVMLTLVYLNALKGAYSAKKHWGVEAVVKYWHMVDLVWVFFYPALYLINHQ